MPRIAPSLSILLLTFTCLALPTRSEAGPPPPPTNILYGFISSNTTLTATSPGPIYSVIGDLVISPGVTLTIQPGVLLIPALTDTLQGGDFTSRVEIDVRGSLVADGTAGDSIRFSSSNPGAGSWGQIKVESGGSVFLRKCAVRGAITGLVAQGGGTLDVADVSMYCGSGVQCAFGNGHLRQCTIVGPGSSGTGLDLGASVDTSPFDSTDAVPTVVSRFYYGVLLETGAAALNLLVRDNQVGITSNGSGPQRINYCTSTRNDLGGLAGNAPGGYVLNSIATSNNVGVYVGTFTDYCDMWSNNYDVYPNGGIVGPHMASFNPFFLDPANNNFRLASGSIFKSFSNSGREIGAYGPGPGAPVPTVQTSWGRLKNLYR